MKKIFMDSGAFTAWSQGEVISLRRYCLWLKQYRKFIDYYAVLDVIGDPQKTWDAQREMEDYGVQPIPCFHFGEDAGWLEKYLKCGYEYIAIGGMVGKDPSDIIAWLDPIWEVYLTNKVGQPVIKVHGFGMTSPTVMLRYPWFSVDSSTWTFGGRTCSLFLIRPDGMADAISMKDGGKGSYASADSVTRKLLEDQLAGHGLTIEKVQSNYWDRNIFNVYQQNLWTKKYYKPTFMQQQKSMFFTQRADPDRAGLQFDRIEMYFAGFSNEINDQQIWDIDAPGGRMLSYHYEQNKINNAFQLVIDNVPK